MYEVGIDKHMDLVRFLQEHDELQFLDGPEPVIYEPVVRTRGANITIGKGSRIDSFVKLEGGVEMRVGRYVHIASFAHVGIGGGTTILEDFTAVASGARIISGSNQVDAITMSACAPEHMQRVKKSVTTLRQYSVVLSNAVVLPGVTLGQGAVLAAGAVATKDIPDWEIWAGVPAKLLAKRVLR